MSMDNLLIAPPIAFLIILAMVGIIARALAPLALKRTGPSGEERKSYACGEDVPTHLIQPDYSQFFPFAFFFTVLHVVALIVATVPVKTIGSFWIAVLYVAGALVGLVTLFRR